MNPNDKSSRDLHKLLSQQNFQSQAEVETFMQNLMGKPIPSFEREELSDAEKAEDLIYEVYETGLSDAEAKKKPTKLSN